MGPGGSLLGLGIMPPYGGNLRVNVSVGPTAISGEQKIHLRPQSATGGNIGSRRSRCAHEPQRD
jgi:hypothetical protein